MQVGFEIEKSELDYQIKAYSDNYNRRLRLLSFVGNFDNVLKEMKKICKDQGLGKIIYFGREKDKDIVLDKGFVLEGVIQGYFCGETAYCCSYYYEPGRADSGREEQEDEIIRKALASQGNYQPREQNSFIIREVTEEDAEVISFLFQSVFTSYPTPMDDVQYVSDVMNNKVFFKAAQADDKIVSIASADLNKKFLNAEITDCVTLQEYRGKGMLTALISSLEQDLKSLGYRTLFSLSRADTPGINIALSKLGYNYEGRMKNNCFIMGKLEDMNIWVKQLTQS